MAESEAPETEAEVMRRGAAMLAERLPTGWSTRLSSAGEKEGIDGLIEVLAADGQSATFVTEAKRVLEGRDVGPLREQLQALAQRVPNGQAMLMARYLSPPLRAKLAEVGLSYIDATGNMRVE